jgi:hypothetical protein
MPPKFGRKRATISDEFLAVLTKLHNDKAQRLAKSIEKNLTLLPNVRGDKKSKVAQDIQRDKKILDGMQKDSGDLEHAERGGLEGELMKLKRLSYEEYNLKDRTYMGKRQIWLIGKTQRITTKVYFGREIGKAYHAAETRPDARDAMYDFGQFFVCINASTFGQSEPHWHLLPVTNYRTISRHLHHAGYAGARGNPLDYSVRTCWGAYNGIIQALWIDADVPEIFHILYQFASHFNPQSPMHRQVWDEPHINIIEEES